MPYVNSQAAENPIEKYQFIHHFLPHEENKTRAGLLSHHALAFYIIMVIAMLGLFRLLPSFAPGVLGYASDIKVDELYSLTNQMREQNGLQDLSLNSALSRAAKKKAEDMFKNDYWAHISPSGTEPWDFILGENYDYIYAGENLAKNFNRSGEVVEAWMNSPSHRDNLLNEHYDEIGFAVVNGVLDGYETTLVVQMFGRPRSPAQVASVEDEQTLLEQLDQPVEVVPEQPEPQPSPSIQPVFIPPAVAPAVDVPTATKSVSIVFGGFVASLLGIDVWYSKRKGIPKFTGHTFAHLTLLAFLLVGVLFVLSPGKVL